MDKIIKIAFKFIYKEIVLPFVVLGIVFFLAVWVLSACESTRIPDTNSFGKQMPEQFRNAIKIGDQGGGSWWLSDFTDGDETYRVLIYDYDSGIGEQRVKTRAVTVLKKYELEKK